MLRDLQPGIPKYFSYRSGKTKIDFFIVKTGSGASSYLDACTKCFPQKKGFRFEDGSVVCRACDERYPLTEIEKGFGSCYPIKLAGSIKDGRYIVSVEELVRLGARFFR